MKYDVTIGIPFYRSVDYIGQTLESALSQTYPSIEFLLIDDAGGDGSLAVVKRIQETHLRGTSVRVISHDRNYGVSASRNHIIEEAKGEFLYFLDSDDVIVENTIELLIQNIRQYDAEIAFGSYERQETTGKRTVCRYPSLRLLKKDELAKFAYRRYAGIQASACNYLVKTSLLRDHNFLFVEANYWEDLVFTFDLVTYISRAVLLPDITYFYICRDNSLSHYQQRKHISKDEIMQNVRTINHLKETSSVLYNKDYYPNRCFNIVMTDFYIVCNILKHRSEIKPSISSKEMREMMCHPAKFSQICHFRQSRWNNILLYTIGKVPPSLCVTIIWIVGKIKKLI